MLRVLACLGAVWASGAAAHEFWIEPHDYELAPGEPLVADLVNGERFEGNRLPYLPRYFQRFEISGDGEATPVEMRAGDRPALEVVPGEGLQIVTYVSAPSLLTYDDWDTFMRTVAHKDLMGGTDRVAALHDARGLPRDNVTERFSRFSKSLVAVGEGAGTDAPTGMLFELVALDNPYAGDADGSLRVQLLFDGAPRSDTQIEVFDRVDGGAPAITTVRTDADGIAEVAVEAGHEYMLDAVLLRLPVGSDGPMWETLWANLTFASR